MLVALNGISRFRDSTYRRWISACAARREPRTPGIKKGRLMQARLAGRSRARSLEMVAHIAQGAGGDVEMRAGERLAGKGGPPSTATEDFAPAPDGIDLPEHERPR